MNDITIRPYQKGDEVAINKAFNYVFGQNRSIEEWYWKFRPQDGGSRMIVAVREDGTVAAQYAAVFTDIQYRGKIERLTQNVDVFCLDEPDLRKKRIFLKTARAFMKRYCEGPGEVKFCYGIPGETLRRFGRIIMGYKGFVPINYLYRESPRLVRPLGKIASEYLFNRNHQYPSPEPGDVDSLWERSKDRYETSLVKDGAYFKRRYMTHPAHKYQYIKAYEDSELRGVAVLTCDNNIVKIVDLLWDGVRNDSISNIVDSAFKLTTGSGAAKIEMWLNNDDEAKDILIASGMREGVNPYDFTVVTMTYDPAIDADYIANSLYFTMGDTDMF